MSIANAPKIDIKALQPLTEVFERAGAAKKAKKRPELQADLDELERLGVEAAIEARQG